MKTVWKIAATLFLLTLTLLSCGFIKKDMSTTINKNGSVDISFTYLVADNLANLSTGENIVMIRVDKNSPYWKTMEKRGYTVEETKKDGYTGFTATCHYDTIKDISKDYEEAQGSSILLGQFFDEDKPYFSKEYPLFLVKKGLFKDTYSTYIGYEFTRDDLKELEVLNDEDNTFLNFSLYEKEMTMTYTVTIPNNSLVQGITAIDDSTATWELPFGHTGAIDYSFTMYNRNFYLAVFGGIGLFVVIAAVVVTILLIKRKHKSLPVENTDLPAPQSPEETAALLAFISGETDTPPENLQGDSQPEPEPQPAPAPQPRPQPAPAPQPRPQSAPAPQPKPQPAPQTSGPTCPHCGGKLTIRVTATGDVAMVCENYPTTCKFTMSI